MHPILFSFGTLRLFGWEIGPIQLYSYGLCLALALGLSITLFARDAGRYIAPRVGLSRKEGFQRTFDLAVWVILCSIAGARIFYALENHTEFTGRWVAVLFVWQGGLVYYGGLFGGALAGVLWFLKHRWPLAYSADVLAPYISLGQAIGRMGCFLNGCCYGIVDEKHGLVFPGIGDGLPHLPTQLWELYGDLALFAGLWWARRFTLAYPWMTLSAYGLTYGMLRFGIEFWRRDWDKRYLGYFVSASQAVSALLIAVSLAVLVAILWRGPKKAAR
ncbi:MAG TPA: prolipoprotein diacylglyceryl transferase family protein [bacterium]|nr:prolipoprotein diacylglyceryl transferase family protein [bacterium]